MATEQTKDLLDEVTEAIAGGDQAELADWEATKLVSQMIKARKDRGLSRAHIAERMGVTTRQVARLENRPWGAGFGRVLAYARAVGVEVRVVDDLPAAA